MGKYWMKQCELYPNMRKWNYNIEYLLCFNGRLLYSLQRKIQMRTGMNGMKRPLLFLTLLLFVFVSGPLHSVEVSEEKDIAIFGMSTGRTNVPPDVLIYAESSIGNEFIKLRRFNVLGYENYRLEAEDVDEFIERVKELQVEKAKQEGTYDEKFGTVVIRGEDFDRIVGSVLIVIPAVADYRETYTTIPIFSGEDFLYFMKNYSVNIAVDLTFFNVKTGTREEAVRVNGTGQDHDLRRATREAVDSAVSKLALRMRQVEVFKIRSGVVRVQGDRVFFELGSDIGVKPGHEYEVLTKQEIGSSGRITQIPTGLVRVKSTYPDLSEAQIVYQQERITEGDQLVEAARKGIGIAFYGGAMQVDIPTMNYNLYLVSDGESDKENKNYYIDFGQKERNWAPELGLSVEGSLGYRFQGLADLQVVPTGTLWGFLGEFGVGTRFYKRRYSLQLKALGGLMYMTSFSKKMQQTGSNPSLIIDGTVIEYGNDPTMTVYGFSFGAKLGASFNYRIGRGSAVRLGVNYRAYTPIEDWSIDIKETSGSSKEEVSIDSNSDNIAEIFDSEGLKRVSISGFEFIAAFTVLF